MATPLQSQQSPSMKESGSVLESGTLYEEAVAAHRRQTQRQRRRRRAFHFLGLFTLLSIYLVSTRSESGTSFYSGFAGKVKSLAGCPDHDTIDIPTNVVLGDCADWGSDLPPGIPMQFKGSNALDHEYSGLGEDWVSVSAEFSLPVDSALYLVSRGIFSVGGLEIVRTEDESVKEAKAEVEMRYRVGYERFLQKVKVCKVAKVGEDGSSGVGIFTPRRLRGHGRGRHPYPHFLVKLALPGSSDDVLRVPSLQTDMPIFRHALTGLEAVSFGLLDLQTANAAIFAEDVRAENVSIINANAPITGTYRASSTLTLATANAPIDVELELQNANESTATVAKLTTSNAPVKAESVLTSTSDSGLKENVGGNFSIEASTKNAHIRLGFESAPINSELRVNTRTAMGPAEVQLHPTFQGGFDLKTTLGRVKVEDRSGAEDPEGKDRKRVVEMDKVTGNRAYGSVYWDEEQKGLGQITVETVLGPVSLIL